MKHFRCMKICSWTVVAMLLLFSVGAWAQTQPAAAPTAASGPSGSGSSPSGYGCTFRY